MRMIYSEGWDQCSSIGHILHPAKGGATECLAVAPWLATTPNCNISCIAVLFGHFTALFLDDFMCGLLFGHCLVLFGIITMVLIIFYFVALHSILFLHFIEKAALHLCYYLGNF